MSSDSRISKLLSLVLRHDPARVGISLDEHGWVDVSVLLDALASHGSALTREKLEDVVAASDKRRFALSEDGTRIRANQGHSVSVDLELDPVLPPTRLYHGTVAAALDGIRAHGLLKQSRHHVHLSADRATAARVGSRRGAPVILAVRADEMAAAGHHFYRSANGVWLVEHVPPSFVDHELPAQHGDSGRGRMSREDRVAMANTTLAACDAGFYTNAAGERTELATAIEHARSGTVLHEIGDVAEHAVGSCATRIEVTGESTLAALVRLDAMDGGHLACLNFASAKNPGGGFLGGAQAQEESLARASALYPCLQMVPSHYARNRAHGSVLYLDLAIFSPHVPFFRDDGGAWLAPPVLASVITCAAPNAGALRQQGRFDADAIETTLRRRGAFVLGVAAHHRVRRLVLGAWGAGVFANDPVLVADVFARLLIGASAPFAGAFDAIVFAVLDGSRDASTHRAFVSTFGA